MPHVSGDPDGLPVVFANSLGTDLRVWDPLLPHLPAGLRIVRYDMRGHGLSDAPEGDYWMGDLVADAAGLMDALGHPRRGLRRPLHRRGRRPGPRGRAAGPRARRGPLQHRRQDRHRGELARAHRRACARAASRRSPTGCWRSGSPRGSTPGAPTSSPSGGTCWSARRSTATAAAARRSRTPTCASRPPACGCRSSPSPAPTTARRRRIWCARPPRASPAPASRSSAAPATSPASRRRRRWRGSLSRFLKEHGLG